MPTRDGQMRAILDNTIDGIITIDLRGCIESCNASVERIFGYEIAELIGQNVSILAASPDAERHDGYVADYLRTGAPKIIGTGREVRGRRKDGRTFPMYLAVSDIQHDKHRSFIGIVRDLSERAALEDDLRRIYDLSSDLICTLGFDGCFQRVNPAFLRTLGHPEETLLYRPMIDFVHEDDRKHTREMLDRLCQGASCADSRNRCLCADGTYKWLAWQAVPSVDSHVICAVARDDTERKTLEDSLRHAKYVAESASEAKGQFLANMSHEIRTPLNAVIGYSTLLLDTQLTAQQLDYLQAVRTAADALLGQLNAILDLSKIEVDKLELEQVSTDLRLAMEDTLEILAESARKKRLQLTCLVDADCPNYLRSDPGRLRQVLINLVGNAIKFTERGEITVRARVIDEGARRFVRIEVSDTGPGIPAESVPRLFQSFSQVDASMARRHGGSGLGLFLCRKLVAALGGMTGVQSQEGVGSTFWFTLPLILLRPTELPVHALPAPLRKSRILVIDDHAASREQLGQLLRQILLEPILCESTQLAERFLDANPSWSPNLVLIANTLPDGEDVEFASVLRQRVGIQNVRIVHLVLPREQKDGKLPLPESFDAQLLKPIRMRRLLRVCHELLDATTTSARSVVPSRASRPSGMMPRFDRLPPRILVAEDNPANQRLTMLMLQRMGCRVDVAADGKEAVRAATGFPYDLILMDVQMPVMDGLAATRELRRRTGPASAVPIVALTANAFSSDREVSFQAGMNDFLCKPVTAETLQGMLRRWLPLHFLAEPVHAAVVEPVHAGASAGDSTELQEDLRAIHQSQAELTALLDEESAKKVLEIIKDDWPKQMKLAQAKLESLDLYGVSRSAHYLAGSAVQVGAKTLAKRCKELEAVAGGKNQQSTAQLLAILGHRIRELLAAL